MRREARATRALVFTHRWLGIAGGLLFLLWFVSGIAMLWARMPELDEAERLRLQPELDLGAARVSPADAARTLGVGARRACGSRCSRGVRSTASRRPADGRRCSPTTAARSSRSTTTRACGSRALSFQSTPRRRATIAVSSHPISGRSRAAASLPAHRIRLGDEDDTWIYLDERTGELVLTATRGERRSAYVSAVPHWLYFTPLRRHGPFWSWLVIALSLAGCVLALTRPRVGRLAVRARRGVALVALHRADALAPLRGPRRSGSSPSPGC